MKVTTDTVPMFKPLTITLESADEVRVMCLLLNESYAELAKKYKGYTPSVTEFIDRIKKNMINDDIIYRMYMALFVATRDRGDKLNLLHL